MLAFSMVIASSAACGLNADDGADQIAVPPVKVAWINEGAEEDEVWTAAHARGAKQVDEEFGSQVETVFIENVNPSTEAADTIDELVASGAELIFATSLPFSRALIDAAKRHPETAFEQARGVETADNLGTYGGADEEPLYLAGIAAGAATDTGVIGFVGTVPEPETIRHINAFTIGVRSQRADATVVVSWVRSWWDPDGEAVHAEELIDRGADVLATGFISTVTGEVARRAGAAWVAHDADYENAFPNTWLTAAVPDWGPFYVDTVRSLLDDDWAPDAYYGDIADSFTDIATLGETVPPPVRARIKQERAQFARKDRHVFRGPLLDNTGTIRVRRGHALDHGQLMAMDWYVDGVVLAQQIQ